MDITAENYITHLPRILDDLAVCRFVSLDFEFSGINYGKASQGASTNIGAQSLQERYTDIKKAADTYQILQIGLTICLEDEMAGSYTLKPYNLYLSPTIDHRLGIDRQVVIQTSAADFLLGHNFSMDSLFNHGVKYLSRDEEKLATTKVAERRDRDRDRLSTPARSLGVKDTDQESIEFLEAVRRLINEWLAIGDKRDSYLNIPPPARIGELKSTDFFPSMLNRFQRRLVHQLVETAYPSLVTISKPMFIQIVEFNQERETAVQEQRMVYAKQRIWKQKGFSWVAEALAGGDLSKLDKGYFNLILNTSVAVGPGYSLQELSDRLKEKLKLRRPILVGHNLFTDLIYFCRLFFGPLPARVEDFQAMAHEMFPVLMDTKYMATHDCGSINPVSSLAEINDSLAHITKPRTSIHPYHAKYHAGNMEHEAGYDSLLAAQIFIKLSAQLRNGGTSQYDGTASDGKFTNTCGLRNRFDILEEETADTTSTSTPAAASPLVKRMVDAGELIPRFDAKFWEDYGNKLRVFGTEERMCVMR